MKRMFFILIPLIILSFFAGKAFEPARVTQKNITEAPPGNIPVQDNKNKFHDNTSERVKQTLSCKSCHSSEYPTKNDPGLLDCPRTEMIPIIHPSTEGPEIVVIDEMSDYYTGVVFPHKIHSEMSEMSGGCNGCHHYNTAGPVMNCRKCHEGSRSREDITVPDLKAAYHRQCMTCHKEWSNENGCNNICHKRKDPSNKLSVDSFAGKTHPKLTLPGKIVWETRSKINKTVTFFHDEHIQIFKLECKSCHTRESCVKCHSPKARGNSNELIKIEKSVEEHHKPCSNCHLGNSCQKCHQEKEMMPFNHAKTTGWVLKSYHSNLECSKCHGSRMPYRKLDNNCASCHKSFTTAFDHKLMGFIFSENHKELECKNCHVNGDFIKKPVCTDCHDDKSLPTDVPGKRVNK